MIYDLIQIFYSGGDALRRKVELNAADQETLDAVCAALRGRGYALTIYHVRQHAERLVGLEEGLPRGA